MVMVGMISIQVTSPDCSKTRFAVRFQMANVIRFPGELEGQVEGIEGWINGFSHY
jgi:hypothetical protein